MDTTTLYAVTMNLDKLGTYEQTASVVDALWNFSSPFIHSSDKGWKAEIEIFETLTSKKMNKKMRDRFRRDSLFRKP